MTLKRMFQKCVDCDYQLCHILSNSLELYVIIISKDILKMQRYLDSEKIKSWNMPMEMVLCQREGEKLNIIFVILLLSSKHGLFTVHA